MKAPRFRIHKQFHHGFTVVEIAIIAPIVILVIGAFIGAATSMSGDVLASRAQSELLYNIQDSLNRIDQDAEASNNFLAVNSFTLQSPQGADNNTSNFYNVTTSTQANEADGTVTLLPFNTALIINEPATIGNPLTTSSTIAYQPIPNACSSSFFNQNTPLMMNVVYYVNSQNSLVRRVLMPSGYKAVCKGDGTTNTTSTWQSPSCASVSGYCTVLEDVLIKNVTNFSVNYYTKAGLASNSPDTTASNPSVSAATRNSSLAGDPSVQVSITASTTVAGRAVTQTSSAYMTRANIYNFTGTE